MRCTHSCVVLMPSLPSVVQVRWDACGVCIPTLYRWFRMICICWKITKLMSVVRGWDETHVVEDGMHVFFECPPYVSGWGWDACGIWIATLCQWLSLMGCMCCLFNTQLIWLRMRCMCCSSAAINIFRENKYNLQVVSWWHGFGANEIWWNW